VYTSRVLLQVLVSPTIAILVVEVSEYTQIRHQDGAEPVPTFPAAICASKPLAIDLAVKMDPPLFGAYHTEPGSCGRTYSPSDDVVVSRLTLFDPVP